MTFIITTAMSLLNLPNELIILIATHLKSPHHLLSFLLINRRLSLVLPTSLYHLATCSGLDRGLIALLWAITTNNESMLKILLAAGPRQITVKSNSGKVLYRLSHRTCTADAETTAQILAESTTVHIRVKKGKRTSHEAPALHWAARIGHEALLQLLLSKGAAIDVCDRYENTALHCAAAMNREGAVRILLNRGADRYALSYFGDRPLDRARFYRHTNVAMVLLKDADVAMTYRNGMTALHLAAEYPVDDATTTAVRSLLERGADVNAVSYTYGRMGATAIYPAIVKGNEEVVRLLIDAGAWRNPWTVNHSLFGEAVLAGRYGMARFLLEAAPAGFKESDGQTLLHLAMGLPSVDASLMTRLLEKGISVNALCSFDRTPLHRAVQYGRSDIVEFLLARGAEINALDMSGRNALMYAAAGQAMTFDRLDIKPQDRGTNINMLCIARLLLDRGAEINVQSNIGITALHSAVLAGGEAMVRLLLEFSPDLSLVDSGWRTPMEMARANITMGPGWAAIFSALEEAM